MRPPLSVLFLALLAAGCAAKAPPLVIGLTLTLTGSGSDFGIASRDAATMAVDEASAAGGVRGRPVTLAYRDDQGDPDRAVDAVRELWVIGARVVIGPVTGSAVPKALDWAARNGVLLVTPSVSTADPDVGSSSFVRFTESTKAQATRLAEAALARGRRRVMAIVDASNARYSGQFAAAFGERLTRSGGLLLPSLRFMPAGLLSAGPELGAAMAASSCDAVLIVASAPDTGILAQFVRRSKPGMPLFASGWAFSGDLLSFGGSGVEGLVITQEFYYDDPEPAYRAFRAAYERRFGRPVDCAALFTYEAVKASVAAIRRASEYSAAAVRAALLDPRLGSGLVGTHHPGPYLYQVTNGAFRLEGSGR